MQAARAADAEALTKLRVGLDGLGEKRQAETERLVAGAGRLLRGDVLVVAERVFALSLRLAKIEAAIKK